MSVKRSCALVGSACVRHLSEASRCDVCELYNTEAIYTREKMDMNTHCLVMMLSPLRWNGMDLISLMPVVIKWSLVAYCKGYKLLCTNVVHINVLEFSLEAVESIAYFLSCTMH